MNPVLDKSTFFSFHFHFRIFNWSRIWKRKRERGALIDHVKFQVAN